MSTEFEVRCDVHGAAWPEGGVTGWNLPQLVGLVGRRQCLASLAELGDVSVSLLGAYGAGDITTWMHDHVDCRLIIRNEYGEEYWPNPVDRYRDSARS